MVVVNTNWHKYKLFEKVRNDVQTNGKLEIYMAQRYYSKNCILILYKVKG